MKRMMALFLVLALASFLVVAYAGKGEEGHGHGKGGGKHDTEAGAMTPHGNEEPMKAKAEGLVARNTPSQDSEALRKQIKALADEVAVLKTQVASLEMLKPTFAQFMPNFSERFHVMHLAGQDGDWAIAAHELMEMKRMVITAKEIDGKNGQLMQGFLAGSLQSLETAINHGNLKKFNKALVETLNNCNNCHKAAGSPFIKISLDVHKLLSMRHSHALQKSKVMSGHKH